MLSCVAEEMHSGTNLLDPDSRLLEDIDAITTKSALHVTTEVQSSHGQGEYSQGVADELPLLLGVRDTGKTGHEPLRRVDDGEIDAEVLAQRLLDLVALVEAHEAVVHEHSVATQIISTCVLENLTEG